MRLQVNTPPSPGFSARFSGCLQRYRPQTQNTTTAKDGFVSVNGIRLHYVDWGGAGPSLLFLTGLGDSAHSFDRLAVGFTDRFHVLGLTRRGQGESDKPPSGYDPRSLAEDIRAFLDVMKIQRVTLAGFSVAGSEETLFAGTYPARVDKLVYLDSAEDYKSGTNSRPIRSRHTRCRCPHRTVHSARS